MCTFTRVYFTTSDELKEDEEEPAEQPEEKDDYLVDHSIVTYFVDDEGRVIDFFAKSLLPSEIVERIEKHMNKK